MSNVDKNEPGTIGWFDLATSDPAAARGFYEDLFGWTITAGPAEYGGYGMCMKGDRVVAGVGRVPPGGTTAWSAYFISADADATAARVTEHGGTILMPPMDVGDQGRMLVAADPAGAVFGVWQPIKHGGSQLANEPGSMAWAEVNSRDAAKARAFYERVFDLETKPLPMPGMEYWTLERGGRPIGGVFQMDDDWPASVPSHWLAYFQVEDVDDRCKRTVERGGRIVIPAMDTPYGRVAVIEDPQGAKLSLMQAPAGNSQQAPA